MIRKAWLSEESTLDKQQISTLNSLLNSLYNRLNIQIVQPKDLIEPVTTNIGSPVGAVYDYTGKRLDMPEGSTFYFRFKLRLDTLSPGYSHEIVKNLPAVFNIRTVTTSPIANGSFLISSKNANNIVLAYVLGNNQNAEKGFTDVLIIGDL